MGDMADWMEQQAFEQMFQEEYIKEQDIERMHEITRLYAFRQLKWRTAGGETLLIQEMTSDHISNCIELLKRNQEDEELQSRARLIEILEDQLKRRQ